MEKKSEEKEGERKGGKRRRVAATFFVLLFCFCCRSEERDSPVCFGFAYVLSLRFSSRSRIWAMAPGLSSNEIPSRIEAGPLAVALFFRGGGMRLQWRKGLSVSMRVGV